MAATAPKSPHDGRSLVGLFSDLFREASTLVHEEAELAKAEISEKVSHISTGVAAIAIAGGILFAGFLFVLLAAVGALGQMLPADLAPWLAPLIVGVVVLIAGFATLAKGRKELTADNLKPKRTMESMRRDGRLVQEHTQ